MIIWGTLIGIAAAVVLSLVLGPYGILVLIATGFGMMLSTYIQTKEIHADVQRIKEKLGITDEGEPVVSNEEIEAELERALLVDRGRTTD